MFDLSVSVEWRTDDSWRRIPLSRVYTARSTALLWRNVAYVFAAISFIITFVPLCLLAI